MIHTVTSSWFRGRWDENRGDEYAHWGSSTWLFATDKAGIVTKQVEIYDGGAVLVYDEKHSEDAYGGLSDQPIDSPVSANLQPITEAEFEQLTGSLNPLNRRF